MRWRALIIAFALAFLTADVDPALDATLHAVLKFLATQQPPDGSFGGPQPHLKPAFALLATLSAGTNAPAILPTSASAP